MRKKRAREAREALERSTSLSLSISGQLDSPTRTPSIGSSPLPSSHSEEIDYSVKLHGTESFRGIIGVGWMAPTSTQDSGYGHGRGGELVVVERPMGDFLGELPPAFVVASFGRS